jgi:hypothetical protein
MCTLTQHPLRRDGKIRIIYAIPSAVFLREEAEWEFIVPLLSLA